MLEEDTVSTDSKIHLVLLGANLLILAGILHMVLT